MGDRKVVARGKEKAQRSVCPERWGGGNRMRRDGRGGRGVTVSRGGAITQDLLNPRPLVSSGQAVGLPVLLSPVLGLRISFSPGSQSSFISPQISVLLSFSSSSNACWFVFKEETILLKTRDGQWDLFSTGKPWAPQAGSSLSGAVVCLPQAAPQSTLDFYTGKSK